MSELIRKFSPIDIQFGQKLSRYIIFRHFLEQSELIFVISEYLSVHEILRLSSVSRDLRFLVHVPYIEIRILKCKLQKYQHPQTNSRNQIYREIGKQYNEKFRKADRAMLRISDKKKSANYTRQFVDFTQPHQKIKKLQQSRTLVQVFPKIAINIQAGKTERKVEQKLSNQLDYYTLTKKQDKKKRFNAIQRYRQQLAKIRNKNSKTLNNQFQQVLVKTGGSTIPLYKPKSLPSKTDDEIKVIRTKNGRQIPIVQIKPGEQIAMDQESRFKTYRTLNYLRQSFFGVFKWQ